MRITVDLFFFVYLYPLLFSNSCRYCEHVCVCNGISRSDIPWRHFVCASCGAVTIFFMHQVLLAIYRENNFKYTDRRKTKARARVCSMNSFYTYCSDGSIQLLLFTGCYSYSTCFTSIHAVVVRFCRFVCNFPLISSPLKAVSTNFIFFILHYFVLTFLLLCGNVVFI